MYYLQKNSYLMVYVKVSGTFSTENLRIGITHKHLNYHQNTKC